MGQRKNFRHPLNDRRKMIQRGERAGENEYRQQKENRELNGLRLVARDGGDEQAEAERAQKKKQTNQRQRGGRIKSHFKMKRHQ